MKACTLGRQCVRICAETCSESIILRIQKQKRLRGGNVYASAQESPEKTSFCVYRSRRVCEGSCIRICAESFSENIILRIQMLGHLRGAMCTHLCRKLQRKHHFEYTEANASARGTVYASIQKPAAKSSFYVHIVSPLPGLPLHGLLCAGRLPSQTAACAVKEGILESLR